MSARFAAATSSLILRRPTRAVSKEEGALLDEKLEEVGA
jgi:hypothetical protein